MPHIFLDESGQFTKRDGEKYFIVSSFMVGNPRRTKKQFHSWCRTRFPRKMRNLPEIKFSHRGIDNKLKLKTLKFIADLDIRIRYVYLLRRNIPEDYYKKQIIESGHLYTNIIGELLEMYLPTTDLDFRVFCDRRHLKGMKRSEFKKVLRARLSPQLPKNSIIQIEMIDSTTSTNIQIVDWVSGALACYLEKKEIGKNCYRILKDNILKDGSKELFEDYWQNKYKNKNPNIN